MIRHALIAALLGRSLIALDITGFGPWLIAQPLVAGRPVRLADGACGYGQSSDRRRRAIACGYGYYASSCVGIPYDAMAVALLARFFGRRLSSRRVARANCFGVDHCGSFWVGFQDDGSMGAPVEYAHSASDGGGQRRAFVRLVSARPLPRDWSGVFYVMPCVILRNMLAGAWLLGKMNRFLLMPGIDRGLNAGRPSFTAGRHEHYAGSFFIGRARYALAVAFGF